MISIRETFQTEAEAAAWAARYLSDYHPLGYSTRLDVRPDGDRWVVIGSRFSSCN
jgi:hypothetical protein